MTLGLLAAGTTLAEEPIILPKGTQAGFYLAYGGLAESGNFIENAMLTSDGQGGWTSEKKLWWKNGNDWADYYCYAPYVADVNNPRAVYFTLRTDQTTAEAQAASDFFYGRSNGFPQSGFPSLQMNHLLSKIVVKIVAGEGFTESELKEGELSVLVKDVYTQAKVNLIEGRAEASGSSANVKALAENALTYSAIIAPQEVSTVSVVWNNTDYPLALKHYCSGRVVYTLTATLKKASGGINISIGGWEDSGEDFGGTVN